MQNIRLAGPGLGAAMARVCSHRSGFFAAGLGLASAGAGNVFANGSIVLFADDYSNINEIAGVLAAGGGGVGAAAGVNVAERFRARQDGYAAHQSRPWRAWRARVPP